MAVAHITLNKYDNQVGQYKEYHKMTIDSRLIKRILLEFGYGGRVQTKTFYQYVIQIGNSQPIEIYSLSPALFDHLEIHMT